MIKEQIKQKMRDVYRSLSPGEQAVATVLALADKPLTQVDIARSAPFLGAHPQFEKRSNETTLRRVRQIIHDLKVNWGIVVISDTRGYWIPNSTKETEEYLDRMEAQARSSATSYMVTYHAMNKAIGGLKPRQEILFDEI